MNQLEHGGRANWCFCLEWSSNQQDCQLSKMVLHERYAVLNLSSAEAEENKSFLTGFPPTFSQRESCPLTFRGDVLLSFLSWKPFDVCLHCDKPSKDPYGSLAEVSLFRSSQFWPFLLFQVHSYHRLISCIPCPSTTRPALSSGRSHGSSAC